MILNLQGACMFYVGSVHASDVRHKAGHQPQRVVRCIHAVVVPRGASEEQVVVRLPLSQRSIVRTVRTRVW